MDYLKLAQEQDGANQWNRIKRETYYFGILKKKEKKRKTKHQTRRTISQIYGHFFFFFGSKTQVSSEAPSWPPVR